VEDQAVVGESNAHDEPLGQHRLPWRENVDAGTQTAFSLAMTGRGFDKDKRRVGVVWLGIGLYADESDGV
jgi:hypothetical protein